MGFMDKREEILRGIEAHLDSHGSDVEAWRDYLSVVQSINHTDVGEMLKRLNVEIAKGANIGALFEVWRGLLLQHSRVSFDSYMQYLEIDREPAERFWLPRRAKLLPIAHELQALMDDELDELFLSMPPRCGKTTLMLMFLTWVMGRDSELSNLYCSYSDTITGSFYAGLLEIMTDADTYNFGQIFPDEIRRTNAKDETIDLKRKKHYPSMTCRSLYGTLNGACDARGFIVGDDLISGIEEALSPTRLEGAWLKVDNNMIPRAKESCKLLWIGTRWSLKDPQGRRLEMLQSGGKLSARRYRCINVPALDANNESNFNYDYGVGFSTQYFLERRESFEKNNDTASWAAQYMGEPVEREGTLFTTDGFRYYNGTLPPEDADRIFMVCDPAFGGGDFVSAPIVYQYGEDLYIHDVVYNSGDKRITQPKIAAAAVKYDVSILQIEATKTTKSFAAEVQRLIKERKGITSVMTKPAATNQSKQMRIFDKAPEIRERCIFRDTESRSPEYDMFMHNIFAFKLNMSKNRHDDAPDSMAQVIDFIFGQKKEARVARRLF